MLDDNQIKKVFDVLVSTLKLVPKLKLDSEKEGNAREPLDIFLEKIKKEIAPITFDADFFTQIYKDSFTTSYNYCTANSQRNTRLSFFVYTQANSYFKFYVDLDDLAQKVCKYYQKEQPDGFTIPIKHIKSQDFGPDRKLDILINNGGRPYFDTSGSLWFGVATAMLQCLIAAIFAVASCFAILMLAQMAIVPLPGMGIGMGIGMGLFLLTSGIGGLFFSYNFFDMAIDTLKQAYSDVYDNTTQTKQIDIVEKALVNIGTMGINEIFELMEKNPVSKEDLLLVEGLKYRSFK